MQALVLDTTGRDVAFVREVLRDLHYAPRVVHVKSGAELLAAMKTLRPDILFSPWNVPDMRLRRMRYGLDALGWEGPTALLADNEADARRGLDAGATFCLQRPFCPQTLKRAMAHFRLIDQAADIPAVEDVEDSWSIALRRPFELGFTAEPIDLQRPGAVWVAEYGLADGPTQALTVLDEPLGFSLAAAVSLLPPAMAAETLRRRAANERFSRNLEMLCRMLTDLFDHQDLQLRGVRRVAHLARPLRRRVDGARRLDLEVTVKDYGRGRAAFLQLAA